MQYIIKKCNLVYVFCNLSRLLFFYFEIYCMMRLSDEKRKTERKSSYESY